MSELIEKLINVRNNGSKRQAHIDLSNECIQEVESLERQLEEAREIFKSVQQCRITCSELEDFADKFLKEKGDE